MWINNVHHAVHLKQQALCPGGLVLPRAKAGFWSPPRYRDHGSLVFNFLPCRIHVTDGDKIKHNAQNGHKREEGGDISACAAGKSTDLNSSSQCAGATSGRMCSVCRAHLHGKTCSPCDGLINQSPLLQAFMAFFFVVGFFLLLDQMFRFFPSIAVAYSSLQVIFCLQGAIF